MLLVRWRYRENKDAAVQIVLPSLYAGKAGRIHEIDPDTSNWYETGGEDKLEDFGITVGNDAVIRLAGIKANSVLLIEVPGKVVLPPVEPPDKPEQPAEVTALRAVIERQETVIADQSERLEKTKRLLQELNLILQ